MSNPMSEQSKQFLKENAIIVAQVAKEHKERPVTLDLLAILLELCSVELTDEDRKEFV